MPELKTAQDYPETDNSGTRRPSDTEDFDYSNCVLVRAFEESPEFSSHNFQRIAELVWYTHIVDRAKLPDDPDEDVCIFEHDRLDVPFRRHCRPVGDHGEHAIEETVIADVGETAAQGSLTEVPAETGIISPYTKLDREDGMDEDLFRTCLNNLAYWLDELNGITTVEDHGTELRKYALKLKQKPEWQHREDEIFAHAVERVARVHNSNQVEKYKAPARREPDWLEECKEREPDYETPCDEELLHRRAFAATKVEEFETDEILRAEQYR